MTGKQFTAKELEVVYQIVKEYKEKSPESEDEYYNDYYDEYEEPINKKIISSVLKKVAQQLPKEIREEIDKCFLRKRYHTYNNFVDDKVYRTLKKALSQLKTVEISYFNRESAKLKKRNIDVYYTSAKYTIGYCHLRKDMRKFRTNRIASAKLTDQTYNIPQDFNKNDY
ncbi:MAG: WYL domain-containing protein [Nanoarchaeota archaeon]|nr:WYL domain-containing protein [Nanoarchaeota archaeon]MBU1632267.1 WYL domain-containing protein [Nanoarchaeota archaeon]MBU1876036.1 WYL domain-containing protein [Nanoarchaeota archaeon]